LLNEGESEVSAGGLLLKPRLCEAQAHGPQGRGYSLEAFSQSDVRSTILDVGRRFAVIVFKGAIPENAVPADDFAKG
jgi:hypothetical protein